MWDSFKREYNKKYGTMEEEMSRFSHFITNLKIADHRNLQEKLAGGSAVHGITKFSDMSQEEFQARYLRAEPGMKTADRVVANISEPPKADLGLVDWTGKYTTPVKDQGYCGSCWAFSATEQIESEAIRQLGVTYLLSAEQITQCATGAFGCGGGWTETAYAYVKNFGGLEEESEYPYTSYKGVTGQCHDDKTKAKVTVTGFTTLKTESDMASYVQTTGPLSVCLDANGFNSYNGGIMTVCGKSVDHCVQAVGVDASTGGYWKVRNSWGAAWGEDGYIRLAYGKDTCAITNDPTYADVKLA
jgi:C1A family cysteine protease